MGTHLNNKIDRGQFFGLVTFLDPLRKLSGSEHRRFQTRTSPGIARVKFWSIVLIAYHYIVLRDDGAESCDSKDNRQSLKRDG